MLETPFFCVDQAVHPLVHTCGEVEVLPLRSSLLSAGIPAADSATTDRSVDFMQGCFNQPGLLTSLFTKGNLVLQGCPSVVLLLPLCPTTLF